MIPFETGGRTPCLPIAGMHPLGMTETEDWKRCVYESLVTSNEVRALAWKIVEDTARGEDPRVSPIDMAGARNYLKTCLLNMSQGELANLTPLEAAALLARGAIGSARWRSRGGSSAPTASRTAKKRLRRSR